MSKEFEGVIKILENIGNNVNEINKRITVIEEVLPEINKNLNQIKSRMDLMENRMSSIESRMDLMEDRMNSIESRMDSIENKIDEMNQLFNTRIDEINIDLNDRMDSMNKTLVLIEEKITTDFPALFEIYSLNYEMQKDNEKRLKTLSKTTGKHSIQISNLEETIKNHENKLKKLIS